MNNNLIINRLKQHFGFKTDKELYTFLGVNVSTFSSWKSKCQINYELIIEKTPDIDLNWLFRGEKSINKGVDMMSDVEAKYNDFNNSELKERTEQLNKALDAINNLTKLLMEK